MKRAFTKFQMVLFGDILNPLWRSRKARRLRRYDVLENVLGKYLKRYLPIAANVPNGPITKCRDEKIFTIWLQGEENAPPLVRACWASVRKHCTQELVILDEKTLFDYIQLPDFVLKKRARGTIGNAHFSDIARVELMHRYGGFWMDATLFVTSKIPQNILDSDFFMFVADKNLSWGYGGVQNFFIRARQRDYLLAAWREMIYAYWREENGNRIDYLVHQLLFKTLVQNDARAAAQFEKMPHISLWSTHQLWRYRDQPFDKALFDTAVSESFFQKTTYNHLYALFNRPPYYRDLGNIIPGSFADAVIGGKIK